MDDNKKLITETEFGQRATVERETKSSPESARATSLLLEAGSTLNPRPDVLQYLGAAAVHIYSAPTIGQVVFISQLPVREVPEPIASKAVSDLRGSMMEAYGRARQKKRSGF